MKNIKLIIGILMSFFVISFLLSSLFSELDLGGNVAVIQIRGELNLDRDSGYKMDFSSSHDMVNLIKSVAKNDQIEAVIFDINSPGGSPVATDEISEAIKKLDKPTITVIREVGASGAYWIASSTDVIFANRMSLVGSIGATASYLDFSGLLERYNVSYERLVSGEYKDMGSPFRELTDEERDIFTNILDRLEDYFVEEVANNRNMPLEKVKTLADGQIFLGVDSLENGLIDYLGNIDDAKYYIENNYNISVETFTYGSERGVFSGFFSELPGNWFGVKI